MPRPGPGRWAVTLTIAVAAAIGCSSAGSVTARAPAPTAPEPTAALTSATPLLVRDGTGGNGPPLMSIDRVASLTPAPAPGGGNQVTIELLRTDGAAFDAMMNSHEGHILAFTLGPRFLTQVVVGGPSFASQFTIVAPDTDLEAVLTSFGDRYRFPPATTTAAPSIGLSDLFQRVTPNGTKVTASIAKRTACDEIMIASVGPSGGEFGATVDRAKASEPLVVLSVHSYYRGVLVIVHSNPSVARVRWDMGAGDEMAPVGGWALLDVGPAIDSPPPPDSVPPTVTEGGTVTAYDAGGRVVAGATVPDRELDTVEEPCTGPPTTPPVT